MSSSDHLQYEQLQMFMPAGELMKRKATSHPTSMPHEVPHTEWNAWKWKDNMREDKYLVPVEGQDERIGESILKRGVLTPVEVGPTYVAEGHHRIAISAGIDPTREIPVLHGPRGPGKEPNRRTTPNE